MKYERAIVFCCNREYLFALGAMLYNINNIHLTYDKIIVITDMDDTSVNEKFFKINNKVEFRYYSFDDFVNEFNINTSNKKITMFIKRYSYLAYFKFKIFDFLKEFRHILFLDLDMYITSDINELFELDSDIAWRDGLNLLAKFTLNKVNPDGIEYLKYADVSTPSPNGGLIIANDSFDYNEAYEMGKKLLREFIHSFPSSLDELIFGIIASYNKLRVKSLDASIYNSIPMGYNLQSKIIHFIGEHKPWSVALLQGLFPGWIKNYRQFVHDTGITSDKVQEFYNIGEEYKSYIFYKKMQGILNSQSFSIPQGFSLKIVPEEYKLQLIHDENYIYSLRVHPSINSKVRCYLDIRKDKYMLQQNIIDILTKYKYHMKTGKNNVTIFSDEIDQSKIMDVFYYLHNTMLSHMLMQDKKTCALMTMSDNPKISHAAQYESMWKKILAMANIPQEVMLPSVKDRHFLQFSIRGLSPRIHYELVTYDQESVYVAFHIEDKTLWTPSTEAWLTYLSGKTSFKFTKRKLSWGVEKKSCPEQCVADLVSFVNTTLQECQRYFGVTVQ